MVLGLDMCFLGRKPAKKDLEGIKSIELAT
jgi:hypothetical protein